MNKIANIKKYLENRGWVLDTEKKAGYIPYLYYAPPPHLDENDGYRLAVYNGSNVTDRYFNDIVQIIHDFYADFGAVESIDDLTRIFNTGNTIFTFRLEDKPNEHSINFVTATKVFSYINKALNHTAKFTLCPEPIFLTSSEHNKYQESTNNYIDKCRMLLPQAGSFISRIELPNADNFIQNELEIVPSYVAEKLVDILSFLDNSARTISADEIDENYLDAHKENINIEVFESIISIFEKSNNIITFNVYSIDGNKKLMISDIKKKLPYYKTYKDALKKVLANVKDIEYTGVITELKQSPNPKSKEGYSIVIEKQININSDNNKIFIHATLKQIDDGTALDAFEKKIPVFIKGRARESTNAKKITYTLTNSTTHPYEFRLA